MPEDAIDLYTPFLPLDVYHYTVLKKRDYVFVNNLN